MAADLPRSELLALLQGIDSAMGATRQVMQVVSAYGGEGCTTVSLNAAMLAAQVMGRRTLLVDAGVRRGQSALSDLLVQPVGSLNRVVEGDEALEGMVTFTGSARLWAARLEYDADLGGMEPGLLDRLVTGLRAAFDLVIFDCPPVLTHGLPLALGRLIDGTLMVVEAERTRAPVVRQACQMLDMSGAKLLGTVLNKRRYHIPKAIYRWL